jgi:hypothetical protein
MTFSSLQRDVFDPVVFGMGADPSNKHLLPLVIHLHDQSVFVSSDIEDHPAVARRIGYTRYTAPPLRRLRDELRSDPSVMLRVHRNKQLSFKSAGFRKISDSNQFRLAGHLPPSWVATRAGTPRSLNCRSLDRFPTTDGGKKSIESLSARLFTDHGLTPHARKELFITIGCEPKRFASAWQRLMG